MLVQKTFGVFGAVLLVGGCAIERTSEPIGIVREAVRSCSTYSNWLARLGANERLDYGCYAARATTRIPSPAKNNMLPDFSYAGYRMGGVAIPTRTMTEYLSPRGNNLDDAGAIQARFKAAADNRTPLILVLSAGTFTLKSPLTMNSSGVVLRGQGQGTNGTLLYSRIDKNHTLLTIAGDTSVVYPQEISAPRAIVGDVPVGATEFVIKGATFWTGSIIVRRTPNAEWLEDIGANNLEAPWLAGEYRIPHPRQVTNVVPLSNGVKITIDVPIVDAINAVYGESQPPATVRHGGYVTLIGDGAFVQESGIEDLRIDSEYHDTSTDDNDWNAIALSRAKNSWVRRVTVKGYGKAAVKLESWSSYNTIEEVAHLDPLSPPSSRPTPASGHRYSFWVQSGVGNLFQRCFTRNSRHSFVTTERVTGPNVWLDSLALNSNADEGPHMGWSTGLLFDNIRSEPSEAAKQRQRIVYGPNAHVPPGGVTVYNAKNRGSASNSHGWTGAQVMIWNCQAPLICDAPGGAMNWVVGGIGAKYESPPEVETPDEPFGIWQLETTTVKPRSLYLQQLEERLDPSAVENVATSEQRAGRIWDALADWAGEGKLSDHLPDPTCTLRGKKESGTRVCCAKQCIKCGGPNCGTIANGDDGTGQLCCANNVTEKDRSCAHHPGPCVMPSPACEGGLQSGNICCAGTCAQCTSSGSASCSTTAIAASGRSCLEYPPPCVMADLNCISGVQGGSTCCDKSCNQCEGTGCGTAPNNGAVCCRQNIEAMGALCSGAYPPCMQPSPVTFWPDE